MMKPHKHAALIKQWADDITLVVEWRSGVGVSWMPTTNPGWVEHYEYRIKPAPKPDIVSDKLVLCVHHQYAMVTGSKFPNVRFIFDGETANLKSVEMLPEVECAAE